MIFAAYFLALLSLLLNASLFLRLRPPWNFMVAVFQIVAVDFSPFLIVPLFGIAMDAVFIRREERMMAAEFGKGWLAYKAKVRRWL